MMSPYAEYKFYEIDEHKNYVPHEITERPLRADMLKDDMAFILKTMTRIVVWNGKNASANEKRYSFKIAMDFKKNNPDSKAKISRVPQGAESAEFKSYFEGFYTFAKQDFGVQNNMANASETTANQDISVLANRHKKACGLLLDKLGGEGNYTLDVYWVKNCEEAIPIDPKSDEWGKFFSEENYLIDLKSKQEDGYRYIVSWQGPHGAGERQAKCMDVATY